jgi:hypothetical protein
MRRACRSVIASLLLLQTCHATSIVWVISETGGYVVLAADSRDLADVRDPKFTNVKTNDRVCKAIALGDTLFLNSGAVLIGAYQEKPWWRSLQAARETYKASNDHGAEQLSIAWGNRALAWFYEQNAPDLQSLTDPNGEIVSGGFINFDSNGNPNSFEQSLLFNAVTRQLSRRPMSQSKGQIGILGLHPELVVEFEKAETPRALKAYGTLKIHNVTKDLDYDIVFVRKAVQFVIDNVNDKEKEGVHGPIDVVVLRRSGGIRWVTRKPNCYSQDLQSPKKSPKK